MAPRLVRCHPWCVFVGTYLVASNCLAASTCSREDTCGFRTTMTTTTTLQLISSGAPCCPAGAAYDTGTLALSDEPTQVESANKAPASRSPIRFMIIPSFL